MIDFYRFTDCALALIILVNPVSKIFVVSTFEEKTSFSEIRKVIIKASIIAMGILFTFAIGGDFVLKSLFNVNIYSLKIVGGIVLLLKGYQALSRGLFFETSATQRLEDVSIVPLASPMIAGPATIAASVSFPSIYGLSTVLLGIIAVVLFTGVVMFLSKRICSVLARFNIMGALIRITGLIVATIGTQMALDGIREFLVFL